MFPAMIHRGRDAWGWMECDQQGNIGITKMAGECTRPEALGAMQVSPNITWWVGHVRAATNGDPCYMGNNHPVEHGSIVGVHNGVISNYESILKKTGRQDPKAKVDSEAIFAAIHKWGHAKGLSRVIGSMVVVYVDKRYPHSLRIARSQQRPLVLAKTPAGSLMFASEEEILRQTDIDFKWMKIVQQHNLLRVKGGKIRERVVYYEPPKLDYARARREMEQRRSIPWSTDSPVPRKLDGGPDFEAWVARQMAEIDNDMRRLIEKERDK